MKNDQYEEVRQEQILANLNKRSFSFASNAKKLSPAHFSGKDARVSSRRGENESRGEKRAGENRVSVGENIFSSALLIATMISPKLGSGSFVCDTARIIGQVTMRARRENRFSFFHHVGNFFSSARLFKISEFREIPI